MAKAAAEFLRDDDIRVAVVPSRSIVQTLSAVAVHDSSVGFDDDVVTMARASSATRYGGVTVASKEAITTAGGARSGTCSVWSTATSSRSGFRGGCGAAGDRPHEQQHLGAGDAGDRFGGAGLAGLGGGGPSADSAGSLEVVAGGQPIN